MAKRAPHRSTLLLLLSYLLAVGLIWDNGQSVAVASAEGPSFIEPDATSLTFPNAGGGDVIGIAQGDFNGDGKLDLAVTQDTNVPNVGLRGFVSVLLGNGDGTFQTPTTIPIPDTPTVGFARGILAKDFDRDGALDLVVAVAEQRQVLFFKGHGDGTFDNPVGFGTTDRCSGVQTADLNGDGFLDLVTFNDQSVSVLLGNGNGTFGPASVSATNAGPQAIALADVNGTNRADIVVGCYGDGNNQPSIDVLLNNGGGVFPSVATRFNQQVQVLGLYAADFDGDGKVDVVACGFGGPTNRSLFFIKGSGDGTFSAPPDQNYEAIEDIPLGSTRFSENVAPDLNGDGHPDVLVNHGQENLVTVGLGTGDGHFNVQELVASNGPGFTQDAHGNTETADGNGTNATIVGDFNGDGKPDLVVGSSAAGGGQRAGSLSILLGAGPGTFLAPHGFALLSQSGFYYAGNNDRSAALGDFNGDGNLDFITLDSGPGSGLVQVLRGNGDGTFGTGIVALGGTSGLGTSASTLRVADMNGDGKLDVIVTSGPAGVQGNQGTTATRIAYGAGDGTFTYAVGLPPGDPSWSIPNVVVADFNNDGAPDLAVLTVRAGDCCNGAYNHIEVFRQQGGTFVRTAGYPATDLGDTHSSGLAAADLDGDGFADLVAVGQTAQAGTQLVFFKGNGDGTFQAPVAVGPITLYAATIGELRVVDLNHDSTPDVVATGYGGVSVYLGNGHGSFEAPVNYSSGGSSVSAIDLADLDGDGNLDIAFTSNSGFTVSRGQGDGTFAPPVFFATGYQSTRNVTTGDLNGDGRPDVVVGHDIGSAENIFATVLLNDTPVPTTTTTLTTTSTTSTSTSSTTVTSTVTTSSTTTSSRTSSTTSTTLRPRACRRACRREAKTCEDACGGKGRTHRRCEKACRNRKKDCGESTGCQLPPG